MAIDGLGTCHCAQHSHFLNVISILGTSCVWMKPKHNLQFKCKSSLKHWITKDCPAFSREIKMHVHNFKKTKFHSDRFFPEVSMIYVSESIVITTIVFRTHSIKKSTETLPRRNACRCNPMQSSPNRFTFRVTIKTWDAIKSNKPIDVIYFPSIVNQITSKLIFTWHHSILQQNSAVSLEIPLKHFTIPNLGLKQHESDNIECFFFHDFKRMNPSEF